MTDKFLAAQTFISDPVKACDAFENLFAAPACGEEEIDVTEIEYENDRATAIVGGGSTDITQQVPPGLRGRQLKDRLRRLE